MPMQFPLCCNKDFSSCRPFMLLYVSIKPFVLLKAFTLPTCLNNGLVVGSTINCMLLKLFLFLQMWALLKLLHCFVHPPHLTPKLVTLVQRYLHFNFPSSQACLYYHYVVVPYIRCIVNVL